VITSESKWQDAKTVDLNSIGNITYIKLLYCSSREAGLGNAALLPVPPFLDVFFVADFGCRFCQPPH